MPTTDAPVLPKRITEREPINPRLGIKSSLSSRDKSRDIKTFIATYLAFYCANDEKSILSYSTGNAPISINNNLLTKLNSFFATQIANNPQINFEAKINNSQFFQTQFEPLQVAMELYWKLGKIMFVGSYPDTVERKGGSENRLPKIIHFSTNAIILKQTISNHDNIVDDAAKDILFKWITKATLPTNNHLEEKIWHTLNCFSEEVQLKIIVNGQDIIFQQEGIYDGIINNNTVASKGDNDSVGPFRILKAVVGEDLHPYLSDSSAFYLKQAISINQLKEYKNKVSTYLDLTAKTSTTAINLSETTPKHTTEEDQEQKRSLNLKAEGNINFTLKNILFKGVPGTGKSHVIDELISKINPPLNNVKRINIHSASSNADLMQGIGIGKTEKGSILYSEKQGQIYKHIQEACFHPKQAFVLVLEEIQENSLNELIGDLIYLIEKDKRAKINNTKLTGEFSYQELIESYIEESKKKKEPIYYVEIPNLVSDGTTYRKMIMPDNLYIFCTSNYRDDKKVIEDNLLRRFDVIEMYPQYTKSIFKSNEVANFLQSLNDAIIKVFSKTEIHPDRFLIGHANWYDIEKGQQEKFYKALLKVFVEFKEIKEIDFSMEFDDILDAIDQTKDNSWPFTSFREIKKEVEKVESHGYKQWVDALQCKVYAEIFNCKEINNNQTEDLRQKNDNAEAAETSQDSMKTTNDNDQ